VDNSDEDHVTANLGAVGDDSTRVLDQLRFIGDRLTVLADRQTLVTDHIAALDGLRAARRDPIGAKAVTSPRSSAMLTPCRTRTSSSPTTSASSSTCIRTG
jgi:hypothetical protein